MDRLADNISAEVPDWRREYKGFWTWYPSKSLLASLRSYQRHQARRGPWHGLMRYVAILRHRWWSAITGADIPLTCQIAGGLVMPHPNGIVIHPEAVIGPNCLIFQQVTVGADADGTPHVGGHVDIGAGAKVLGPIRVHDHAAIGANAVVVKDVPRAATAVGVPARILPPR